MVGNSLWKGPCDLEHREQRERRVRGEATAIYGDFLAI